MNEFNNNDEIAERLHEHKINSKVVSTFYLTKEIEGTEMTAIFYKINDFDLIENQLIMKHCHNCPKLIESIKNIEECTEFILKIKSSCKAPQDCTLYNSFIDEINECMFEEDWGELYDELC